MKQLTIRTEDLIAITGSSSHKKRKENFAKFLNAKARPICDVMRPHKFVMFISQLMHESGDFRYSKELWGPTKAQQRYEGRVDLGNVFKGDGKAFMGRGFIQVTGRDNYRSLTKWLKRMDVKSPDFEKSPDSLASEDWLGMGAIWYWTTRVPNKYVEAGDIEMVTRRINGGLNGYKDRLDKYTRAGLYFIGYQPTAIAQFQEDQGLKVDGISGPATRAAIHKALLVEPKFEEEPQTQKPKGFWEKLLGKRS